MLILNNTIKEEFFKVYNEVVDSEGNIKACGRENCIRLIEMCRSIDIYNHFGDIKTGRLNISAVTRLYKEISNS